MIKHSPSSSAGRLHNRLTASPIRSCRLSTGDVPAAGYLAPDQVSSRPPPVPREPRPAASTELLTCIAELERISADLKRIVMCTGGGAGSSLREHHYELAAVVHRLARGARS